MSTSYQRGKKIKPLWKHFPLGVARARVCKWDWSGEAVCANRGQGPPDGFLWNMTVVMSVDKLRPCNFQKEKSFLLV